jgi:hypothetical protein
MKSVDTYGQERAFAAAVGPVLIGAVAPFVAGELAGRLVVWPPDERVDEVHAASDTATAARQMNRTNTR